MKKSDPKKGGAAGGAVEDLINYKGIYYEARDIKVLVHGEKK